jgi:uncharacterized membrane protein YebE (DUF533 family)
MDVNKILNGMIKSGVLSNLATGVASGALGGMLVNGRDSKQLGTLVKAGGLAAIGGLAWAAWQKYQQGQLPLDAASGQSPTLPEAAESRLSAPDSQSMLLVRCMIAAAMADGHIDAGETQRIFRQIDNREMTSTEKALVLDALRRPASMQDLVSQVHDLHTATEVYASSLLAIDASCEKGSAWLKALARQLELPAVLVENLHSSVAIPSESQDTPPLRTFG